MQKNICTSSIFDVTSRSGKKIYKKTKGFTLIEVLVVIGMIAILATVVLVAVNPSRQFKLARDSQRMANVNAILNAIHQNISEHKGVFTCAGSVRALPTASTTIKSGSVGDLGDLASCIVPDYISALPFDPSQPGAHYVDNTDYNTGYTLFQDTNGRVNVFAIAEMPDTHISVTR